MSKAAKPDQMIRPAQAQTRPQPSDADADLHPLAFEGGTRQYLLRLPPGPPADPKGWPLVVVFHGGGGDALNVERMTRFTELGRQQGFAVLYPQGTSAAGQRLGTWNAQHCCGTAMRQRKSPRDRATGVPVPAGAWESSVSRSSVRQIQFDGAQWRNDIGHRAIKR